jgi:hypothetical protein
MPELIVSSWADEIEEDDTSGLPAPTEKVIGDTKITTEYTINDDEKKVKVVRTFKVVRKMVPKSIAQRKQWDKFGVSRCRFRQVLVFGRKVFGLTHIVNPHFLIYNFKILTRGRFFCAKNSNYGQNSDEIYGRKKCLVLAFFTNITAVIFAGIWSKLR